MCMRDDGKELSFDDNVFLIAGDDWHKDIPAKSISCSDGELTL